LTAKVTEERAKKRLDVKTAKKLEERLTKKSDERSARKREEAEAASRKVGLWRHTLGFYDFTRKLN